MFLSVYLVASYVDGFPVESFCVGEVFRLPTSLRSFLHEIKEFLSFGLVIGQVGIEEVTVHFGLVVQRGGSERKNGDPEIDVVRAIFSYDSRDGEI